MCAQIHIYSTAAYICVLSIAIPAMQYLIISTIFSRVERFTFCSKQHVHIYIHSTVSTLIYTYRSVYTALAVGTLNYTHLHIKHGQCMCTCTCINPQALSMPNHKHCNCQVQTMVDLDSVCSKTLQGVTIRKYITSMM